MHRDLCKSGFICAFLLARLASAQSIYFSPPAPAAGQAVVATLSEPFNCAAPQPVLTVNSDYALTIDSIFPDGIVNCPAIPVPPPTTSTFTVNLGALLAGTYVVTWNFYLHQPSGLPRLLGKTSVPLVVKPGSVTGIAISPGFTGNWFNHDQSGHGFSVEVLANNQMLAQWYTFAPGGGQVWIVATGPIRGSTAVLQGFYPAGSGAVFPPSFDPSRIQDEPWGTITFTFTDCDNGQVNWQPIVDGYSAGSMAITRLTIPAGLSCP